MIVYRSTLKNSRHTIALTPRGIAHRVERPKAGGGWYTRELLTAPWPWMKRTA